MKLSSLRPVSTLFVVLVLIALSLSMPVHAAIGCSTDALRNAIDAANASAGADTITLAAGCTYSFATPDSFDPNNALPRITSKITIVGRNAIIERADAAVLDFRLFLVMPTGNLTLKKLTVRGGVSIAGAGILVSKDLDNSGILNLREVTVADNNATEQGGGIYNAGTLTIVDSEISGNEAWDGLGGGLGGGIVGFGPTLIENSTIAGNHAANGGGIYGYDVTVLDSDISANEALLDGGGLWLASDQPRIDGSNVSGNTASAGGGVFLSVGTLDVSNTTIADNTAQAGGGIYNTTFFTEPGSSSFVFLFDSTVSGNDAASASIGGGGIYNERGGYLIIHRSAITGNTTAGSGGGIMSQFISGVSTGSIIIMQSSTMSGNTAGVFGGAASIDNDGWFSAVNTLIAGNSAGTEGGGIHLANSAVLELTNAVVTGNKALIGGGGVHAAASSEVAVDSSTIAGNSAAIGGGFVLADSEALIDNSIIWGNTSQLATTGSGVADVRFSDVEGGLSGSGNINVDPLFVLSQHHSAAPTTAGDYHVSHFSAVLDSGSDALLPSDMFDLDGDGTFSESVAYDLEGNLRVLNGTTDMGAFEHGEMLANRDFEVDANKDKVPDGWKLKSPSGDKRVCGDTQSETGNCGFMFKGGAGEAAKLVQKLDPADFPFDNDDILSFSFRVRAPAGSASGKGMVKIQFVSGPAGKYKIPFGTSDAYVTASIAPIDLAGIDPQKIVVIIANTSPGGKVYIDGASLSYQAAGHRSVLPPPAAPPGMRGMN